MLFHSFPFAPLAAALALSLPAVMAACSAGRAAVADPMAPAAGNEPLPRRPAKAAAVADAGRRVQDADGAGPYGIVILGRQPGGDVSYDARRVWIRVMLQPDAMTSSEAQRHPGWRDKMAELP